MIDRRTLVTSTLALVTVSPGVAQATAPAPGPGSRQLVFPDPAETIDLWPGRPPGAPVRMPVERVTERSKDPAYNDRYVLGIGTPRMTVFRPRRPNGSAVLIMPGGGYRWVVIDKEGYEMARVLAARGVTAFVLFYRLPGEGWSAGPDTPLADAQRAMRIIRQRAGPFGIDPKRICAMGFSAGGHVAASLLTRFAEKAYQPVDEADNLPARPDLAAPIYPVISMTRPTAHSVSRAKLIGEKATAELERANNPAMRVPADAPATFLVHAEDDRSVPVENSLMLRRALLAKKVPVETHLYPDGGHGFGLRLAHGKSVEGWHEVFYAWGQKRGVFA